MKNQWEKEEEQRKESIKFEQALESKRSRCPKCLRETAPIRRCRCIGKVGGGGSGGGSSSKASTVSSNASTDTSGKVSNANSPITNAITPSIESQIPGQMPQENAALFNPEAISELLSMKLLFINNDRENGELAINLRDFNLLSADEKNKLAECREELEKFFDVILKELDEFKSEKNLSANYVKLKQDDKGNINFLSITLPTPSIYDAFIQRLSNKQLLPKQNVEQKEKPVYQKGINHFNSQPLSQKSLITENKEMESEQEKPSTIYKKPY